MGRSNPLALRLRGLINWPSNVRHPLLASYVRHIFQEHLVGEPGIRASTTGLWVNVTIFAENYDRLLEHPKLQNGALSFSSVNIASALGRSEQRITEITAEGSKVPFQQALFKNVQPRVELTKERTQAKYTGTSPLVARAEQDGVLEALKIYRDTPIHLQVNVIRNPILNAEILAQYVANQLAANQQLPRIYKNILQKLTA
ncbi:hypothetical protein BDR26DRAFT_924123 [Obelidium mucronatum]|nr:hypothetical protein BDR26DRAFT_924123 [Obelidium mucronatum]